MEIEDFDFSMFAGLSETEIKSVLNEYNKGEILEIVNVLNETNVITKWNTEAAEDLKAMYNIDIDIAEMAAISIHDAYKRLGL